MFTGPVGPVEVLFYWPKAIFGNFYWPGAIGPLLALSPATTGDELGPVQPVFWTGNFLKNSFLDKHKFL